MGTIRWPRRGSMQYWPRKRAKREYARVRSWAPSKDVKALGFAGYKVGMTHVLYTDARKNSKSKGEDIVCPVTVLECPPLKVIGYQSYEAGYYGRKPMNGGILNATKELVRRIKVNKKEIKIDDSKVTEMIDVRLVVQTQPALTGIGKKKPEVFEIAIGGEDVKAKIEYARSVIGKDLRISEIFSEGQLVDTQSITKGKGTQGPVKRFGVSLRSHKAEKTKRGPASLGPWHPHHGNYRVPHAGKMGYHQRTQLNKWIVKISDDSENINHKNGWHQYGVIKNDYILIKGSVDGPRKRLIRFNITRRTIKNLQETAPEIQYVDIKK